MTLINGYQILLICEKNLNKKKQEKINEKTFRDISSGFIYMF